MSRTDPRLLEPDRYPMHTEVQLRFSDLDVNRHLNNVAMIDVLQEARGYYHRASGMEQASAAFTIVVANLNVQFLAEGRYGSPVICHTGLKALGTSSQTIAQVAFQNDAAIAYAETIMVTMLDGKAAAHPADYREKMEPWLLKI